MLPPSPLRCELRRTPLPRTPVNNVPTLWEKRTLRTDDACPRGNLGFCPRVASAVVGHEIWLPTTRLATWIGEDGGESERKLRRKGCVCNRGGERHRPCYGAGVRARGRQRGGR